jgi:glycosyltransferase involved in cell wall biosynthesis
VSVRIALLTEIPSPYRIPLFNALAARDGVDLSVLFLRRSDPRHPYPVYEQELAFDWHVLPGVDELAGGRWLVLSRGVAPALRSLRPDLVLVGGWNQPAFWRARRHARGKGLPLVVWVESTSADRRSGARWFARARDSFVRSADGFVVPGTASAGFLADLGVGADRITFARNAVDLGLFRDRTAAARERRDALRSERGITGCCFLYAGRFAPEKGLDTLLTTFGRVGGQLLLAGSGPEEDRLREAAPAGTRFLGWVSREELPDWYAVADVFVLPSRSEPWGMVLNEAAAAGLPLIASEEAGAARDLIEEGCNGFRVPAGDTGALERAMTALRDDADLRERAGERSMEIAASFTPEAWAEAVAGLAVRLTADRASGRAGRRRGPR